MKRRVSPVRSKSAVKAQSPKPSPAAVAASGAPRRSPSKPFPIVGIGASAGGLEAFTTLLEHLPTNTGMGFVLVQHLAPKHESALRELLARHTTMRVAEVKDGMAVEPDHVYVIPPDKNMALSNSLLRLVPRRAGGHMPIDFFMQSLAQVQQSRAIGVILSGTATDGTQGLRAIKAEGGVTFAQDERSARYDSMPHSAIASGWVDFVLPPERIAEELARIGSHPYVNHTKRAAAEPGVEDGSELEKVFALLRVRTGIDFTNYKPPTIKRRIRRRMLLKKTEKLSEYVRYLQEYPSECDALFDDILIRVTGFFRDPLSFEALKKRVFQPLKRRDRDKPIRVWVPGCSTGEEVYSVVIALLESLGDAAPHFTVQAFATDISERAIATARQGIYSESAAAHLSPERRSRFFNKVEQGYQISKSIRDLTVFARHDVTRDPPYSLLDLICCRNLLIFLGPVLQKVVFSAFHWSLKPGGHLMLGNSESVGEFSEYFGVVDRKHKIYAKQMSSHPIQLELRPHGPLAAGDALARLPQPVRAFDVQRETDRILLEQYVPPGVLVNDNMEIVQFRGHTGPYLDPMPGLASLNLLKVARGDLLFELRASIQRVRKTHVPFRKENIKVELDGQTKVLSLQVLPVKEPASRKGHFLVLFEEAPRRAATAGKAAGPAPKRETAQSEASQVKRLEQELKSAKEYLRAALEDQEAINEELRTANEEILSSNEELQTTNEELETAKEELQSTNEELTTLNEELQNRNVELAQRGSDLKNVLNSVFAALVLVGRDLRIRFFTPQAEKLLNLIPTDIGRSIRDLRPAVEIPQLEQLIAEVVGSAKPKEIDVQGPGCTHFSLRIRPYITADKTIDGAVIALTNVTEQKHAQEALAWSEERFRSLVEGIKDYAIMRLDASGNVLSANSGVEQIFGYEAGELVGKHFSLFSPDRQRAEAEAQLALARSEGRCEVEERRVRKDGSEFWANVVLIALRDAAGNVGGFAKVARDITLHRRAEELSHQLSVRLMQAQDQERQRIAHELHDTAGPSLAALVMNLAQVEKAESGLSKKARAALAESINLAKESAQQVRSVSYELHPPLLDEAGLAAALRWYVESFAQRSEVNTVLQMPPDLRRLPKEVEFTIFRVVQGALMNAHLHSGSPTASVKLKLHRDSVTLEVADDGEGMPKHVVEGLGIRGMRERVRQLGGTFEMVPGKPGTILRATIPLSASRSAPAKAETRA